MKVQVSVIVPVYNAERTLRKCVESVLSQAYDDIEIILVNDGSKDHSLDLCREYEAKDHRVIVLDKPNGGVSSARNAGLDIAKGEWVLFVDADDYLDECFLKGVENAAEDLLVHGLQFVNEYGCVICIYKVDNWLSSSTISDFAKSFIGTPILRTPTAKFFRRSIIANLRFPEDMKVGEDSYFMQLYLARCNSYKFMSCGFYNVLDGAPFWQKYSCTVDYAANSLKHILESYAEMESHLHIGWMGFWSFYSFFKLVSKEHGKRNFFLWFDNPIIKNICRQLWPVLPFSQKAQYAFCHIFKLLLR